MTRQDTSASFEKVFRHPPDYTVRAPGRVNLIGDHTDYTGGLVLPIAVDQAVIVAGRGTDERFIDVHSAHFEQPVRIALDRPLADPAMAWSSYVAGVTALLGQHGVPLRGAELWVGGDLPPGAGLASSAALEVGVALALLKAAGTSLAPTELAKLCQRAEHEFAGSPCGIMDQLCCVSGQVDHALLIDCTSLETAAVPLQLDQAELIVIDTGVRHSIAGKQYGLRRRQCAEALKAIRGLSPRVRSFRDLVVEDLPSMAQVLGDVLLRRVTHVVTENGRVRRAVEALRAGDLRSLGWLMTESHASLQGDFEVSCPELDTIVSTALAIEGVLGARMTGGGFGGCAIVLARPEAVDALREAIQRSYDGRFSTPATLSGVRAAGSAAVADS
jgi:galactokinase